MTKFLVGVTEHTAPFFNTVRLIKDDIDQLIHEFLALDQSIKAGVLFNDFRAEHHDTVLSILHVLRTKSQT